jgi:hypothetical protein
MKSLVYIATLVLVISVGVGLAQDPSSQGIPRQLQVLQKQLFEIDKAVDTVQTTVNTISSWPKKYFLTDAVFLPPAIFAAPACGPGFHFASLWELLDPSGLIYDVNNTLAYNGYYYDQGAGPPSGSGGWIRTGSIAEAREKVPGRDNCYRWTTTLDGTNGTVAELRDVWNLSNIDYQLQVAPWWRTSYQSCDKEQRVWCVCD